MKYITYSLLSDWTQPYETLAWFWVFAELWAIENTWTYVWYIYWTDEDMNNWIDWCSDFSMVEITQQEAIDFFDDTLPDEMINGNDVMCSVWPAYADDKWIIQYDLTPL